jgi:DNA ligase-1
MLKELATLIKELNATNSINEKVQIITRHPECKSALRWTYDPSIQFGVTSDNIKKKGPQLVLMNPPKLSVEELLKALSTRKLTGNNAIKITYIEAQILHPYGEILYKIIDKDLKCRIDDTLINRAFPGLIPEFKVTLAKNYDDYKHKIDFASAVWFASHKLDGVRCICIVNGESVQFFSRTGKPFHTLSNVAKALNPTDTDSYVLDGEICVMNKGVEDFTAIVSEIRRKDHTIKSPRYKVFDCLMLTEFYDGKSTIDLATRQSRLKKILPKDDTVVQSLKQTVILDASHLKELQAQAIKSEWEGLILRKNVGYDAKRTSDMLKVKVFQDAEFKVIDIESAPISFIAYDQAILVPQGVNTTEVMLGKAIVLFKGNPVGVGSGWSIEQRREFHKHPEKIIGKTITVKYFAESKDKNGKPSLRFPTLKTIYAGKERDI